MKDRKQLGKMSKNKGKVGEREVAELVRKHGFEARRGQQFSGKMKGGEEAPDVISSIENTHIEVKRTETLSLYPAMKQASDDAGEGEKPVVFHRRNGKEWLVIMKAEDYLRLEEKVIESAI